MSNHLAVATVTAALGQIVHAAADSAVPGIGLQFGRPVAPGDGTSAKRVNIYLYQVTPNSALRNRDLPTRDTAGALAQRPQAAIDLHYLLSFYGDYTSLEPDRMLGAVLRDLHARPVLTAARIRSMADGRAELADTNLDQATEVVKFTPASMSLDELSKLWSVMVQTPHALSVPYVASVVVIDALESAPAPVPVLRRGQDDQGVDTSVGPFPQLERYWAGDAITATLPSRPPSLPAARLGARLIIEGRNLGSDVALLRFTHTSVLALDPVRVPIAASERATVELAATLPDDAPAQDAWGAGVYTVTAQFVRNGTELQSNALPLVLAPRITAIAPAGPVVRDVNGHVTLTLTCSPKLHPGQRASLLIADRQVDAPPRDVATDTLEFRLERAPTGAAQFVRLRVDGIDSLPLIFDPTTRRYEFDPAQQVSIT